MRSLSQEQKDLIEALVMEGDSRLSNLTPSLLEKDTHLTEALRLIFELTPSGLTPVFCGGTSLSKAYRLIERMSEDADIKLCPSAAFLAKSKSQQQKCLSQYKDEVKRTLEGAGFSIQSLTAQNENKYIRIDLEYARIYGSAAGLRPHLQIEFITKATELEGHALTLNSLVHQLLDREEGAFSIQTQDQAETLAEKVLSFLRRYAQHQAGELRHDWDPALVRHLYDIHQIQTNDSSTQQRSSRLFEGLVRQESKEWGSQFAAFKTDPVTVLEQALRHIEADVSLVSQYQSNLLPLIYSNYQPDFNTVFATFKQVAGVLLRTLDK